MKIMDEIEAAMAPMSTAHDRLLAFINCFHAHLHEANAVNDAPRIQTALDELSRNNTRIAAAVLGEPARDPSNPPSGAGE